MTCLYMVSNKALCIQTWNSIRRSTVKRTLTYRDLIWNTHFMGSWWTRCAVFWEMNSSSDSSRTFQITSTMRTPLPRTSTTQSFLKDEPYEQTNTVTGHVLTALHCRMWLIMKPHVFRTQNPETSTAINEMCCSPLSNLMISLTGSITCGFIK